MSVVGSRSFRCESMAAMMSIVIALYPFCAPEICSLYTLGVRYCHVSGDGVGHGPAQKGTPTDGAGAADV